MSSILADGGEQICTHIYIYIDITYMYIHKIYAIHIYITSLKTNMFASAKMMVGSVKMKCSF